MRFAYEPSSAAVSAQTRGFRTIGHEVPGLDKSSDGMGAVGPAGGLSGRGSTGATDLPNGVSTQPKSLRRSWHHGRPSTSAYPLVRSPNARRGVPPGAPEKGLQLPPDTWIEELAATFPVRP